MRLFLLVILLIVNCFSSFGTWTNLNTGINDELTGIVFWGNNGVVSGHEGLYYTTTGGSGATSWTRFNISGNLSDSLTYNSTKFTHCFSANGYSNKVFACGQDTVNNTAIIIQIELPSLAYSFLYTGVSNSKLNNIGFSGESLNFYAVGDNSLVVEFDSSTTGSQIINNSGVDFKSIEFIKFNSNTTRFNIAADDYIIYGDDLNPGLTFSITPSPGDSISDVYELGPNNCFRLGKKYLFTQHLTGQTVERTDYHYGPLNATSIFKYLNYYFVGTDHGIFRTPNASKTHILEKQIASGNSSINNFWDDLTNTNFYSCGNNGIVYVSTGNGGGSEPYVKVKQQGGCVGSTLQFEKKWGSVTSCFLYLDSVLISTSCTATTPYLFSSTGIHQARFIGSNSSGSDTSLVTFSIIDTPLIDKPYNLSDLLLCKEESIQITVDSTQAQTYYELVNNSNLGYGNSSSGNGASVTFTTDLLSDSGYYQIQAVSSLADCKALFTDSIFIGVEKTKADFHSTILNAEIGESVMLSETCTDANNFLWQFPSGSGTTTSNLDNPTNTFNNTGQQQIFLKCWSTDGCTDSTITDGPLVYQTPSVYDSTWVNIGSAPVDFYQDWIQGGERVSDLSELTELKVGNGYLVSGCFYKQTFPTKHGNSLFLDNFGAYLNKYDENGVLKWNIRTFGEGFDHRKYSFRSSAEDSQGNIYVCGDFVDYYIDNAGDTVDVLNNNQTENNVIMKLDSLGQTIWVRTIGTYIPHEVRVDKSDNIIVLVKKVRFQTYPYLHLDGVVTDTLNFPAATTNCGVLKFLGNGSFDWHVPINVDYNTNNDFLKEVGFDTNNNVYLAGIMNGDATFYSTDNIVETIPLNADPNTGAKSFLIKYDSSGVIQWTVKSYTIGPYNDQTRIHDMEVDTEGNCYLTGSNNSYADTSYGVYHIFLNSDSTQYSHNGGSYFTAKVNKNGICKWVRSADHSTGGYGKEIDIVNDTIYVIGQVYSYATGTVTVNFKNLDSTYYPLTANLSKYFVAVYDTAGYLYNVCVHGNTNVPYIRESSGMFRSEGGLFYYARNSGGSTGLTPYFIDFQDTIHQFVGLEGLVNKFHLSEGICIDPVYLKSIDTTICSGSDYTLTDGSIITNIVSPFSDTLHLLTVKNTDSLIVTNISLDTSYLISDTINYCENQSYAFSDGFIIDSLLASTTHISSFQAVNGCDSLISMTLIPILVTQNFDTIDVCANSDYTFSDGTVFSNINNVVNHTITYSSLVGCDSIVTHTLMPHFQYSGVDSLSVCFNSSYTFANNTTYINIDTIINHVNVYTDAIGCDSTVQYSLIPKAIDQRFDTISVCFNSTYILPDTIYFNIDSIINHVTTFTNAMGCDSLIHTILIPQPLYESADSIAICYNSIYNFSDGTTYLNIDTIINHSNIYTNMIGCDSIIHYTLMPQAISQGTDTITVCLNDTFTAIDGTVYPDIDSIINHMNILIDISGCDSLVIQYIIPTAINLAITQNNNVLTSNENNSVNVDYTWLLCTNGYSVIPGANSQTYTAINNGDYAVIVTKNGCSDTSLCVTVSNIGLNESISDNITIAPNPTGGIINIGISNVNLFSEVVVINALGQKILRKTIDSESTELNIEGVSGLYFIQIISIDNTTTTFKIIKN